jgi:DNA-binding CsgD family transcriptional regulator/tetratricopeptide (TPR) repeat protein
VSTWTAPGLPVGMPADDASTFVGRLACLTELEGVWASVRDHRRHAVFVGGEPGIGKTRLVSEAAAAVHDDGAIVLWGACHPDLDVPYRPFVTAIEQLLDGAEPGVLAPALGDSAAELHRLTPAVLRHRPDLAAPGASGGDIRLLLFDAVRDLLLALAARQPVVLILEDLHWAAPPTLQLLTHLVQSTVRARLLLLVTHRTTAPDRNDQLTYAISDLYRHDGVSRIDLAGLGTEEIVEYLVRHAGMSTSRARRSAAVLRDQTGGNAFFLHELWRDLAGQGGIDALRSPAFRAPRSIRDTLDRRLAGLPEAHREVLELAAVAGEQVDLTTLLAATDHPRDVALAAIDAGVGFGLLAADLVTHGGYRFLHALARQAVLDRMPPSRRVVEHARIAEVLAGQAADDPRVVAQLAHHYSRAHVLGYADEAVTYLVRAAEHAERSAAHEEAAVLYERAAELRATAGPPRHELSFSAARGHMVAGDFAAARRLYEELAVAGDPDVALLAAIGYEDASWQPGDRGPRALELLRAALARRPDDPTDPLRVRGLASAGRALSFSGDTARAREVGDRALELARRLDDDELVAHALGATLWRGMNPGVAAELLARATELSEVANRSGRIEHLGPAGFFGAVFAYLQGLPDEWEAAQQDCLRAARSGRRFFRYVSGCVEFARWFSAGRFDRALETAAVLDEVGGEFGHNTTEGSYGIQMFMLQRVKGALEQVRPLITGDEDPADHWTPGLLALFTELEMSEPASRALRAVADRLEAYRTNEPQWAAVLAYAAEAAVWLGDREVAARLRPLLAEYAGMNLLAGQFVAVFGSADRYLGAIDSVLGAPTADDHFERALEMDRRMGAVTHQVETLVAWGEHAARRGGAGTARASRLRAEARVLAERIGHRRALRDLEGAGPTPNGETARPDGLTVRELDVLRLVAEGRSNREIGERLFISQNTAANHVRSILLKTGAANRTGAAIYAAEHDLLEGTAR